MGRTFRVALVGRPNVGKSTLFNKIAGKRKALTFGRPGITRDFISEKVEVGGKEFELLDTGGYVPDPDEELPQLVRKQVLKAIDESDLVVLVLDGKEGPTSIENEILEILRDNEKDFVVAVNKVDYKRFRDNLPAFYEMGIGDFFEVSAEHGTGVGELLAEIEKRIPEIESDEDGKASDAVRVTLVGRPNVGKSTLFNAIIGQERVIASPIPGTTRDTIDMEVKIGGNRYLFLDTAGIRPRRKTADAVDKITSIRSIKSIRDAQVVVLVLDSTEGATHNDQQILRYIIDEGRGVVVAANKIDALPRGEVPSVLNRIREELAFARFAPVVPVSALEKKGIKELLKEMGGVQAHMRMRIKTSDLNKRVGERVFRASIPGGKRLNRAYYMTQTGTEPPSFTVFVKETENIPESFTRFVTNRIREEFEFRGCPIRVHYRRK